VIDLLWRGIAMLWWLHVDWVLEGCDELVVKKAEG